MANRAKPYSVTIMQWGVIAFGFVNLWQAVAIAEQRVALRLYAPSTLWLSAVRLGVAVIVAVVAGGLGMATGRGWRYAPTAVPLFICLYTIYHLLLLAVATSPIGRAGWVGDGLLGIGLWLFSLWALRRTAVQPYFQTKSTAKTTEET